MTSTKKQKAVAVIGEHLSVKGGITSVIRAHLNSSLKERFRLIHLPSLIEGAPLNKIAIFLRAFLRLMGLLLSGQIDLVHIHSSSYASFYRKSVFTLASVFWGKPVIFHIHGSRFNRFFHESPALVKWWIRFILNRTTQIIVLSQSWQNRISQMTDNQNILVLNNPVDVKEFDFGERTNHKSTFTILFLGELCKRKGVYDLLDVAGELIEKAPHLRFVLAGNGDLPQVKQLIQAAGLQDYFEIPGWISPLQRKAYLQKTDLFLLPSYDEGLPVAILEAMASGVPVVSTKVGGIPELIKKEENGLLIAPGDHLALKASILRMVKDENLRFQFIKINLKRMREEFDIGVVAERVAELYAEIAR